MKVHEFNTISPSINPDPTSKPKATRYVGKTGMDWDAFACHFHWPKLLQDKQPMDCIQPGVIALSLSHCKLA